MNDPRLCYVWFSRKHSEVSDIFHSIMINQNHFALRGFNWQRMFYLFYDVGVQKEANNFHLRTLPFRIEDPHW